MKQIRELNHNEMASLMRGSNCKLSTGILIFFGFAIVGLTLSGVGIPVAA